VEKDERRTEASGLHSGDDLLGTHISFLVHYLRAGREEGEVDRWRGLIVVLEIVE
jgi:hypothetical protein